MLQHAITAGTLLLEVKRELFHGEFGDWCREHLEFSYVQARKYMLVAKCSRESNFDPGMSLSAALDAIAAKPDPQPGQPRPMTKDEAEKVLGMARIPAARLRVCGWTPSPAHEPFRFPEENTMTDFNFKGHALRTTDIDGEPWFVAPDVLRILAMPFGRGLGGTHRYLRNLDADERRLLTSRGANRSPLFNATRAPSLNIINESGLYKLVLRSDKAEGVPTVEGMISRHY